MGEANPDRGDGILTWRSGQSGGIAGPLPACFERYFYVWRCNGLWKSINIHLVAAARLALGRDASPSAGIIDRWGCLIAMVTCAGCRVVFAVNIGCRMMELRGRSLQMYSAHSTEPAVRPHLAEWLCPRQHAVEPFHTNLTKEAYLGKMCQAVRVVRVGFVRGHIERCFGMACIDADRR